MRPHPIFARVYERVSRLANRMGEEEHRIELVRHAVGRVLEVGAGNGLNLEHYRKATEVVALEPEPTMLALAGVRSSATPVPVRLVRGVAEALPFGDRSFDTVVASLVLCSVDDPPAAAAEMVRVLRPNGSIRFLEHVRSQKPLAAAVQDLTAGPWSFFAGGCHPNRDPVGTLERAGLDVDVRRFPFGPPSPCRPHVLGTARPG